MGPYYRMIIYLLLAASAFAVGVIPVRADTQHQDMPGKGGQPERASSSDDLTGKLLHKRPEDPLLLSQQERQHLHYQDTWGPEMKGDDLPVAVNTAQTIASNTFPGGTCDSPSNSSQSPGHNFQQNTTFWEEGEPQTLNATENETLSEGTSVTKAQPSFGDDLGPCVGQGPKSAGQTLTLGHEDDYLGNRAFEAPNAVQAIDPSSCPVEATIAKPNYSGSICPIGDGLLQSLSQEELANEQLLQTYGSELTDQPCTSLPKTSSTAETASESSSLAAKTTAIALAEAGETVTAEAASAVKGCGDASFLVLCPPESSAVSEECLRSLPDDTTALIARVTSIVPTCSAYVGSFEAPESGLYVVFFNECAVYEPATKLRLLPNNSTEIDTAQEKAWCVAQGNDVSSLPTFLQLDKGDRVSFYPPGESCAKNDQKRFGVARVCRC